MAPFRTPLSCAGRSGTSCRTCSTSNRDVAQLADTIVYSCIDSRGEKQAGATSTPRTVDANRSAARWIARPPSHFILLRCKPRSVVPQPVRKLHENEPGQKMAAAAAGVATAGVDADMQRASHGDTCCRHMQTRAVVTGALHARRRLRQQRSCCALGSAHSPARRSVAWAGT